MNTINVVIDTNILMQDHNRDQTKYETLKELVLNNKVKIFMPHIIEQEFITNQIKKCKNINNIL